MDYQDFFHERLNIAMKQRSMTLSELAEQTEIPEKTLKGYLTNKLPRARHLIKLCTALKISADYLLGLTKK